MPTSRPGFSERSPINWDMLRDLLQCPACAAPALELRRADVLCASCGTDYRITEGVIDFVGDAEQEVPPLYRNPFYRRFMASLAALHAAHYQDGSFSARLEDAIKRDLFRLVSADKGPNVDLGCGLGNGFRFIGPDRDIIGVDLSTPLLQQTKKAHPDASIIRANLARLPFRTGVLGRVFANAVLEHVFHLELAVQQVERCLAASGRFYVAVPTEGSLAVATARLVTSARNARIYGVTPAQSRIAQRIDHCNTVFGIENALEKHFEIEDRSYWPFKVPGRQINLSVAYRLRHLPDA
jgi:SAM-dependent methyltransferase